MNYAIRTKGYWVSSFDEEHQVVRLTLPSGPVKLFPTKEEAEQWATNLQDAGYCLSSGAWQVFAYDNAMALQIERLEAKCLALTSKEASNMLQYEWERGLGIFEVLPETLIIPGYNAQGACLTVVKMRTNHGLVVEWVLGTPEYKALLADVDIPSYSTNLAIGQLSAFMHHQLTMRSLVKGGGQ